MLCTVPEHLVCVLKKIFDSKFFANLLILRKVMEHTEQLLPTRTKGGLAQPLVWFDVLLHYAKQHFVFVFQAQLIGPVLADRVQESDKALIKLYLFIVCEVNNKCIV